MGQANTIPRRIDGVEGAAGEVMISGGPGALETWGAGLPPGAHEATHIKGGADDIDSALDARAIALANQGEIVFHAAAANTLAVLAVGAAGQALLSGGAGADISWGAPAPAAHAASHLDGAADEIDVADLAGTGGAAGEIIESDGAALSYVEPDGRYDPKAHVLATTGPHTNTLPLTDLEVGVQGNVIHRGAADWAALAVGAAGQALLSGGAGADVGWGAPAPAAHESTHVKGGADDIDTALDARAIALTEQGDIPYHAAAANTLAALVHGAAGEALLSGGHAANPSWGAPAPAAHAGTHAPQTGGDPLNCAAPGAINENASAEGVADYMARSDHNHQHTAALHENGGGAEINVGGLSGALADAQTPAAHHTTHESGGADEIKDMELDNSPGTNDTGSGILTMGTVGEIVTAGQVLYLKADGKYWKAKGDAVATMPGKVLAMAGIAADAAGKLLHLGYFRHDAWDFTVGNGTANLLYVDKTTGGLVTQTAPAAAGDQVQVIGYCVTADIIFFSPCLELVEIAA